MEISRNDLIDAALKNGLTNESAESLWQTLQKNGPRNKFNFFNVMSYVGGLIIFLAMFYFIWSTIEDWNNNALFIASSILGLLFASLGAYFYKVKKLRVPGGLLIFLSVIMVPLIIYSLENILGWWKANPTNEYPFEWDHKNWFLIELSTFLVSLVAIYFIRFPVLLAETLIALWLAIYSGLYLLFGEEFVTHFSGEINLVFGALVFVFSKLIDRKTEEDFAFWGYFISALSISSGLFLLDLKTEWGYFFIFVANLILIALSVLIQRVIFIVVGCLGVLMYVYHLADVFFKDTIYFPFVLTAIGLLIIFLTILLQRFYKTK